MLTVVTPDPATIRRRQEQDGAYYWSLGTERALRAIGIVSVRECEPGAAIGGPALVVRGVELSDEQWQELHDAVMLFEPPVHPTVAGRLGLSSRRLDISAAEVIGIPRTRRPNRVEYPSLRDQPAEQGAAREAPATSPPLAYWDHGWQDVPGFEMEIDGTRRASLLQRRGNHLALTLPLFDVIGRWLYHPPLADRAYSGFASIASPVQVLGAIANAVMARDPVGSQRPHVIAEPYPDQARAAFCVRHDYDRPVGDEQWSALLDAYRSRKLKASVGFLSYELPVEQMRALLAAGHEAQVHAHARSLRGFMADVRRIASAAGERPRGFTVHGGPSSPGFVGDRQFRWAEAAGLAYGESVGPRAGTVVPLLRVDEGVPYSSRLLVTPEHFSLDGSTRHDDHHLGILRQRLPAALGRGDFVILMNHPDIHRHALLELLDGMDLDGVWGATADEVVTYRRATHFEAAVRCDGDTVRIELQERIPWDAGFWVSWGAGRRERVVVAAGSGGVQLRLGDEPKVVA